MRMRNDAVSSVFKDSKPHCLRGVAALVVIWYHVFEGFATSPLDQHFNHGYLAVDFFFILSGFVVGYAYDDRWKGRIMKGSDGTIRTGRGMRVRDFLKRRLIRLHPMVVLGAVLGAVTYLIQGSVRWDGTPVPFSMVMLAMLLGMFLIPAYPGAPYDVRGNNEMYPLNGPSWSQFFEYVGNILYALVLRRLSTKWLAAVTVLSGMGLAAYALSGMSGFWHLGVGWSLADWVYMGASGHIWCIWVHPAIYRTASRSGCASFSVTYPIRCTSSTIRSCTYSIPIRSGGCLSLRPGRGP